MLDFYRRESAFICHYRDHWLTIRKLGNQWFNLNSILPGPQLVSDTYLSLYLAQLQNVLQNHSSVERTKESEEKLLVFLKQDLAAEELNTYLFQHNIVLEHLVKRKNSLEEQFLELTKN